jgi:hypothetical protein
MINDPLLDIATVTHSSMTLPEISNEPLREETASYARLMVHPFYKHLLGSLDQALQEINEAVS